MNHRSFKYSLILASVLFSNSPVSAEEPFRCGGENTRIYTGSDIAVSVCHGSHVHIDDAKLDQWQECGDSIIYLRDNSDGSTVEITDCMYVGKQFRVNGDKLLLRHFMTGYPGNDSTPFLVETLNLKTKSKSFQFEYEFPECSWSDVGKARQKINAETAKPFNGETYFRAIYGGMYDLRNCAKSQPGYALANLIRLDEWQRFDGEVSETLSIIISEVELIYQATADHSGCAWSKPRTIRIDEKMYFEVCNENKALRFNGHLVVKPNIPYGLVFPDCPECNLIWSRLSPDGKTAVVWIENDLFQRNAWVVDLESNSVKLFIDASQPEGKHFLVEFKGNGEFTIAHAGMGYRTDYHYKKVGDTWTNTDREKVDVKWQ